MKHNALFEGFLLLCLRNRTPLPSFSFLLCTLSGSCFIDRIRAVLPQVFLQALKVEYQDLKLLALNEVILVSKYEEAPRDH